jgi:hypothetical protein
MTLEQQTAQAILKVKELFGNAEPEPAGPPKDATIDDLWHEVLELRKELKAIKKTKRGVKPKVETAVKVLVEDPQLAQIPIPIIAEIIREVFKSFGIQSKCSERSVRWYLSQYSLEWDIVKRQMPPIRVNKDDIETD